MLIRVVLGCLLLVFGLFSVLLHNDFQFSQINPMEYIIMALSLLGALALFFLKKPSADPDSQGLHTFTFSLEGVNPEEAGTSLREGMQLFLQPYTGSDQEHISVTDEKGNPLGYVPTDYRDYVLSRIESHSLTHTVIEKLEPKALGLCNLEIRITC